LDKQTQRTEIAKTCGWEHAPENNEDYPWWHPVEKTVSTFDNLPDYLNNLDDMHEAEKVLDDSKLWDQQKVRYYHELSELFDDCGEPTVNYFNVVNATAAQRAEAFLKTLNLWQPIK